jgi:leucine dehydrogenase
MSEPDEDLQELIAGWDGVAVVAHRDRPTGAWMFIALHDDTLGRPTGGTRMKPYPTPAAALRDAMLLAEGMTHKWAAVGIPFGGGKAVIDLPGPLPAAERRPLLRRYGELIESLRGSFATGEDLGTTVDDMAAIAETTRHVMGGHDLDGKPIDPGPYTARGVFRGIAAAVHHLDGGGVAGKTVLIQGVGDVGAPLAGLLRAAGARLLLADLDAGRAAALAAELGGEPGCRAVPAAAVSDTECDVFAPCAVGQVLNRDTIPRLRCRAVAGSANNQLAEPADAERLRERGILYAPDYLVNGGGALAFGLIELGTTDPRVLFARVEALGDSLVEIFAEAAARGESPLAATQRRVERALGRAAGATAAAEQAAGATAGA